MNVWLYVHNFLFYLSDPTQEELFKTLLQEKTQVYFVVNVGQLLGTVFNCLQHTHDRVSVHLFQSPYTKFTDDRFSVNTENKVLNMTPYRSGLLIDPIPPIDPLDPDVPS